MMAVSKHQARRAFLSGVGAGAVAAVTTVTTVGANAQQQPAKAGNWQPTRHPQDDWMDQLPGVHRFVIDTTSPAGFDSALLYAGNYYNANHSGYGLEDSDLAVILVARHDSTPFAYNDTVWAKYGPSFVRRSGFVDVNTKLAPVVNIYRSSLQALLQRGVQLAVCQMATKFLASTIARASGANADTVYAELTANLMSNAHMVPAGIVALNRAQERGYAFAHAV